METNILLLQKTLSDLMRCITLPNPQNPEEFVLDNCSFGDCEAMFFELNRFLDNLEFDYRMDDISLRNLQYTDGLKSGIMMCVDVLVEFIEKTTEDNVVGIEDFKVNYVPSCDRLSDEDQVDFSGIDDDEKKRIRDFQIACQYIKEYLIVPIFRERYGIGDQFKRLDQNPANRLTYESRIPFPQRNGRNNSLQERVFNQIGVFFRNFTSIIIGENQLHVFDAHGAPDSELTDSYDIGVKLDGGDVLVATCNQDTDRAISLLEKFTPPSARRGSGIIHLRDRETLYLSTTTHGSIYTSGRRLHDNVPGSGNPFVRTTKERRNQSFENRGYTTDTGQRVYLERSSSGQRLYLGSEQNYFRDRFKLLEKHYQERMATYKRADPTSGFYDCSIDFRQLQRMDLTEDNFSHLNYCIANQDAFHSFSSKTLSSQQNQLQVRSIMILLKTHERRENLEENTRIKNIDFMEGLMTSLSTNEDFQDKELRQDLKEAITYINSDAFIQSWASESSTHSYKQVPSNLNCNPSEREKIAKVASLEDYKKIQDLYYVIDFFLAETSQNNPEHTNLLFQDLQQQLAKQMQLLKKGKKLTGRHSMRF